MSALPLPLRERRIFVDSSAFLALLDRRDEFHARAVAIFNALVDQRFRQFTTNVVVIESHALILSVMGIAAAAAFLRDLPQSYTAVVRVRAQDEERAQQLIFRYADKDFSLTDAISFTVMGRLAITRAFTFDRHFAQYGLTVLEPLS